MIHMYYSLPFITPFDSQLCKTRLTLKSRWSGRRKLVCWATPTWLSTTTRNWPNWDWISSKIMSKPIWGCTSLICPKVFVNVKFVNVVLLSNNWFLELKYFFTLVPKDNKTILIRRWILLSLSLFRGLRPNLRVFDGRFALCSCWQKHRTWRLGSLWQSEASRPHAG